MGRRIVWTPLRAPGRTVARHRRTSKGPYHHHKFRIELFHPCDRAVSSDRRPISADLGPKSPLSRLAAPVPRRRTERHPAERESVHARRSPGIDDLPCRPALQPHRDDPGAASERCLTDVAARLSNRGAGGGWSRSDRFIFLQARRWDGAPPPRGGSPRRPEASVNGDDEPEITG